MISNPYKPIDCSLHDQLLAFATLKQVVDIHFQEAGQEKHVQGKIIDVYTAKTKEEFLKLDSGQEIRLDQLTLVGGVAFGEGFCAIL